MAAKGWTTQVAAAAGVAAATGAAQLGLGYGLGVVVWPVTAGAADSVWLGSLGWATWIAASSTVFGAIIAAALSGARPSGPMRAALAFFAGVGALLTVALVALPARAAVVRPESIAPENTAALYALIGIVLGVLIAYWAVISGPVAANLIATSAYLWTLAATAIVVELTVGRPAATYLTSWQFAKIAEDSRYGAIYWPSALITLGAAFLLGVLAAWPAARRGNYGVGTAASGAVGPVLVGVAFLLLAPQLTGAIGELQSAYLIAPYAVLSGLAGSALVTTAAQRRTTPTPRPSSTSTDEDDWSEAISAPSSARPARRPNSRADSDPAARTAAAPADRTASTSADRTASTTADRTAAVPAEGPSAGDTRPSRGGLFGRRRQESPEDEPTLDLTPAAAEKPSRGGLFGRRQTKETTATSSTRDEEPTAELVRPATSPKAEPTAPPAPSPSTAPPKATPPKASAPAADPIKPSAVGRPRKATSRKQTAPPAEAPKTEEPKPPRKSTVAAPPASPPIAKINPPREPTER
jgi:hypothetical protein